MESVIWTGDNVNEVTEFAERVEFMFSVGSCHGRFKWYHRLADRLSLPRDDKTVLEIHPKCPESSIDKFHGDYSAKEVAEVLSYLQSHALYGVIKAAFDAIESERGDIYHPWHWTTAKPGDRIFADGTVERHET